MVPPKKPEWFEMTEGEKRPAPARAKKVIKVVALTAPLLIVAAGVVIAQSGESGPADAVNATPTVAATVTSDPTPIQSNNQQPAPSKSAAPKVNSGGGTKFVPKPSIAPPTGRGGDDDGEWGEHEGREGGEHGWGEDD